MLYSKFIVHAAKNAIQVLDNGTWYLEPEWKDIICRNTADFDGDISKIEDSYLSGWDDVEDILKLEVTRRNAMDNKKKEVIDWLYELITAQVEPAMLAEETDYIKNVIEFMKTNHAIENTPDNIVPFPTKKD